MQRDQVEVLGRARTGAPVARARVHWTRSIRGRHMQISTWVSSRKLRLISAAVRMRLRNQLELEAVLEELTALLSK